MEVENKIKHRCHYCGDRTDEENSGMEIKGKWYCNFHYKKCSFCGKYHPVEDIVQDSSGKLICKSCSEEEYFICERCGELHNNNSLRANNEGKKYCNECYHHLYVKCNHCCKEILRYDTNLRSDDYGNIFCSECFETLFTLCSICGRITQVSDREDNCICEVCNSHPILDHSTKPKPLFKSIPTDKNEKRELYLGFELEVQDRKYRVDLHTQAKWIRDNSYFYSKYDGSVTDGFEIVSHPFTWGHWRKETSGIVKEIQKKLVLDGYRSFNTTCCGLHVHMSKNSFTNVQLYKFMKLFYENYDFIYSISQRKTRTEMERWAKCSCDKRRMIRKAINKSTDEERYNAVNLCNRHTVEIRIFKGTLNFNSFCKSLEFCKCVYEFSNIASIKEVNVLNFFEYVKLYKKSYPNLYNFLCKKQFFNGELLKIEEIGEIE